MRKKKKKKTSFTAETQTQPMSANEIQKEIKEEIEGVWSCFCNHI